MPLRVRLSKSQKIFVLGVLLAVGVGGVTAGTTIGVNDDVALNLGAGYTTSATCDPSISIASIIVGTNASNYRYAGFKLTDVDGSTCGSQILRLAVLDKNNNVQQASWAIPSNNTNYIYVLGTSNLGATVGLNIFAQYSYASIDIENISKFSVAVSKS